MILYVGFNHDHLHSKCNSLNTVAYTITSGSDGVDGRDGRDGKDGAPGVAGPRGDPGKQSFYTAMSHLLHKPSTETWRK